MKKLFALVLMALVGISLLFSNVIASESRTIPHKTKCVTSANGGQLVVAGGSVLYKVMGYASASNGVFAIVDASSVPLAISTSTVKVEGGEATQYDSMQIFDFGVDGLVFDSGIVIHTSGISVVVEYN